MFIFILSFDGEYMMILFGRREENKKGELMTTNKSVSDFTSRILMFFF